VVVHLDQQGWICKHCQCCFTLANNINRYSLIVLSTFAAYTLELSENFPSMEHSTLWLQAQSLAPVIITEECVWAGGMWGVGVVWVWCVWCLVCVCQCVYM